MPRRAIVFFTMLTALNLFAQTPSPVPASDPQAVSLVQQANAALMNGVAVTDVTLTANVTSIYGSDNETGTATFKAMGFSQSRIDLNLNGGTRSEVRSAVSGGAWKVNSAAAQPYAGHNCITDAAWFFPSLSSLAQLGNPNFTFKYIGQEQHGSVNTQHIRVFQTFPNDTGGLFQRLSTEDFYLDMNTGLPDAIAFKSHSDRDLNTSFDIEIRFANYQNVSGVMVPFHFQQIMDGSVVLDANVTGASVNSGLSTALFNLQ